MVPLKHQYMKVYRDYEKVFGGASTRAAINRESDAIPPFVCRDSLIQNT